MKLAELRELPIELMLVPPKPRAVVETARAPRVRTNISVALAPPTLNSAVRPGTGSAPDGTGSAVNWTAEAHRAVRAFEIRRDQSKNSALSVSSAWDEQGSARTSCRRSIENRKRPIRIVWINADCYQVANWRSGAPVSAAISPRTICRIPRDPRSLAVTASQAMMPARSFESVTPENGMMFPATKSCGLLKYDRGDFLVPNNPRIAHGAAVAESRHGAGPAAEHALQCGAGAVAAIGRMANRALIECCVIGRSDLAVAGYRRHQRSAKGRGHREKAQETIILVLPFILAFQVLRRSARGPRPTQCERRQRPRGVVT